MKRLIQWLFIFSIPLLMCAACQNHEKKWYEGGTLHDKSALDWQSASDENKLATCADFIVIARQKGSLTPSITSHLNTADDIRPYAQELVVFLNGILRPIPDPNVNQEFYANQRVAFVAARAMASKGWLNVQAQDQEPQSITTAQATPNQQAARQTTETNDIPATPKKGLDMTPVQFMDAFNAFARSVKADTLSIPEITLSTGEVKNTFKHTFSKNLVLVGYVRKSDNKILSLLMMGAPKTDDEVTALMLIYSLLMGTFNPELSQEERGSLVTEMLSNVSKASTDRDAQYEAVRGQVRYDFRASKIVGVWLFIENVND